MGDSLSHLDDLLLKANGQPEKLCVTLHSKTELSLYIVIFSLS